MIEQQIQLFTGDCRSILPTLPDASVHMVCTSPPYYALRSYLDASHPDKHREIGSEPTPDAYIATMVAVFREVRRVMRNDAVAFINMGDGYRDKQLLLMPARLALALQADGWWVRSDIIWHKPNPMPESVTDRCVSAHEHVFMLTKAPRYYFDADAIREGREGDTHSRGVKRNPPIDSAGVGHKDWCSYMTRDDEITSRACRNVWTIATSPYSAAHFATFPPELAERCIRAGTSQYGCCAACGKPWVRQTSVSYTDAGNGNNNMKRKGGDYEAAMSSRPYEVRKLKDVETTGWQPGCQCNADTIPCTVLDPFAGAGTTLLVADRLQRDCIGIDLNPDYNVMSRARIEADAPLFTSFPPAEDPEESRMADLFAEAAE